MKPSTSSHSIWARRLGWMVLLWAASVAALAIVAMLLHLLMSLAGMTM